MLTSAFFPLLLAIRLFLADFQFLLTAFCLLPSSTYYLLLATRYVQLAVIFPDKFCQEEEIL
jgi:hypothetical protein